VRPLAPPRPVHVPGKRALPSPQNASLSNRRLVPRRNPLVKARPTRHLGGMATREDILILGLTAGVLGSLTGGLMLGLGLGLVSQGAHIGWLLVLPAGPVAGLLGYVLARRLVKQQPPM
jgi:hypothetical protein